MSKLIALCDGHGIDTAGKRTPTLPDGQKSEIGRPYMNENLFNRAVVKYLDEHLKRCGFRTLLVAPTDADTPLKARTDLANKMKADFYLSIHANANTGSFGSWGGIDTFCMPSGESRRIGAILHKHLIKGTNLRDRGVKDGSHLWVVRKTNMPSVLVECGFMDSTTDYKHLLLDSYRKETALELAIGLCEAFNVPFVPEKQPVKAETKPAPKPEPVTPKAKSHTVEKGETFYGIAKKYGMSAETLQKYNPRVDANKLQVGDVIHLVPVPTSAVEPKPAPKPAPAPKPTPKPTPAPKPSYSLPAGIYKKDTSKKLDAVKQIQDALNKLKFNCGTADGIFGEGTKDALERFQKVHLPKDVDGVYGPATRTKMLNLLNK